MKSKHSNSFYTIGRRRGAVLVITLIILSLATMLAAGLLYRALAGVRSGAAGRDGQQAYFAARSGLNRAAVILQAARSQRDLWWDDPDELRDQLVFEDGDRSWYFTVYAAGAEGVTRYGVEDESGKINLNVATKEMLLALPNMTEELADCLLDWRDGDDEARAGGAESDYYETLSPVGYRARNGPLLTVEELLQVKGFDMLLVAGEDANRNGRLDANEADGEESPPDDNGDDELDLGLSGAATTFSYEFDVDNEGTARVNINGDVSDLSSTGLSRQTQQFIQTYRNEGNTFSHPADLLNMTYQSSGATGRRGRWGRRGQNNNGQSREIRSGVGPEDLATVLDKLTTRDGGDKAVSIGLVNVNSASAAVLAAVPGINADLAEAIVLTRDSLSEPPTTPAWLVTEGLLSADEFKKIAPMLTGRGFQYRVRAVGYCRPGGQFCVLDAVIDLAGASPRVLYLRNLTKLGIPLDLSTPDEGLTSAGQ